VTTILSVSHRLSDVPAADKRAFRKSGGVLRVISTIVDLAAHVGPNGAT
jgi:hypothetical protein